MTNLFGADPAAWDALDRLLELALDIPEEQREAWLAALPDEQRTLAPVLRGLLTGAGGRSPVDTLPKLEITAPESALCAGAEVGRFRLLRRIAEGGMGTVWLAERADGLIRRPVALKLPRVTWRSAGVAERLERERDILAALNHPHIARLLDAGVTADGQPWLALEFVEGRQIDAWVREERPPLRERLEIVLEVMAAVAHAHGRLIVHRDIKPSNILVARDGHARLLDFGIAKLIEEGERRTDLTERMGRALTPDYASPEQIGGEPIGVTSDVYSLGVVLYELLAGRRPYSLSPGSIEEGIRRVQVPKASEAAATPEMRKALRGDLDTILAKALKKVPEERYPTVDAFAADIGRFLAGRPVHARPDSVTYRLVRFVRRHRFAAAASVAIAASLVGGVIATVSQARVARRERARAEQRGADVRRMANALVIDFHDAIVPLAGSTPARKLLVERGLEFLDRLAEDAPGDPDLQRGLAEAYRKLGRAQGFRGAASLGDYPGARESFAKGLRLLEAMLATDSRDRWARDNHPLFLRDLANAEWSVGDYESAAARLQRARRLLDVLIDEAPRDVSLQRLAGIVDYSLGDVLQDLSRSGEALDAYRASLRHFRSLQEAGLTDASAEGRRAYVASLHKLGEALLRAGQVEAAEANFREMSAIAKALLAESPDNAAAQRDFTVSLMKIGDALVKRGDGAGALALFEQALVIARRKFVADPQSAQALRDVAVTLLRIGEALTCQAGQERDPRTRKALWQRARASYVDGEALHVKMKERGQWMVPDEPMLARYRAGIAMCDAALRSSARGSRPRNTRER